MGDNAKTGMNGIWHAGGVRDMKSIEFIKLICKFPAKSPVKSPVERLNNPHQSSALLPESLPRIYCKPRLHQVVPLRWHKAA